MFKLSMDFFSFWTCACFFYITAFGLRPSGLGFARFFFFYDLIFLFDFKPHGLTLSGLSFDGFFFLF